MQPLGCMKSLVLSILLILLPGLSQANNLKVSPARGQTPEQTERDKQECYQSAERRSQYNRELSANQNSRTKKMESEDNQDRRQDFEEYATACLIGKGYGVRPKS